MICLRSEVMRKRVYIFFFLNMKTCHVGFANLQVNLRISTFSESMGLPSCQVEVDFNKADKLFSIGGSIKTN